MTVSVGDLEKRRLVQTLDKRYYTVRDLSDLYDVTERVVLHWIHTGQLTALTVGLDPRKKKPRWRISREALAEFEASRLSGPPAPARIRRRKRPADVIDFIR